MVAKHFIAVWNHCNKSLKKRKEKKEKVKERKDKEKRKERKSKRKGFINSTTTWM
jgi:hypothetical protein